MIGRPMPDAELILQAARVGAPALARRYGASVSAVKEWVAAARANVLLGGQGRSPKVRRCLFCGQPHDSIGPGDRYHRDCRQQVTALDAGRYES